MNSTTEVMFRQQNQAAYALPYGYHTGWSGHIQPVIPSGWWNSQEMNLGQTADQMNDSLANTSTSTTSTASPPPSDLHQRQEKSQEELYGNLYGMQNAHLHAHHLQYPHQQSLQGLPAISSLSWQSEQDEWNRLRMNPQSINDLSNKTRTRDKYRVVYSNFQRLELEKEYRYNKYITIRRKAELAKQLGLSERQVKIWFQNRRAKERKMNKRSDSPTPEDGSEEAIQSDSSGSENVVQIEADMSGRHIQHELDSVNQVLTSMSDEDDNQHESHSSAPAIQSIVQTLVGCTEKYLGDEIKYEPN